MTQGPGQVGFGAQASCAPRGCRPCAESSAGPRPLQLSWLGLARREPCSVTGPQLAPGGPGAVPTLASPAAGAVCPLASPALLPLFRHVLSDFWRLPFVWGLGFFCVYLANTTPQALPALSALQIRSFSPHSDPVR